MVMKLTEEMIKNLPVFDEEECNPEQLAEETIAIVEQAIRGIDEELKKKGYESGS